MLKQPGLISSVPHLSVLCDTDFIIILVQVNLSKYLYVNDVIKPKKENEWTVRKDDGSSTSDHQEVADIYNSHFINKVEMLKANIPSPSYPSVRSL